MLNAGCLVFFVVPGYNFCMANENIQFDVDALQRPMYELKEPKLIRWVIDHSGGLVKDETKANYLVLGASLLVFVLSMYLFLHKEEQPYQPSQQEKLQTVPGSIIK